MIRTTSVCLAAWLLAAAATRAQAPSPTSETLLLWQCDRVEAADRAAGDGRTTLHGGEVVPGKHGNGLRLRAGEYAAISVEENLSPARGTLMFWFRPDWSTRTKTGSHTLLSWRWADGQWAEPKLGDGYGVLSDGWWESGGGADRFYLVFENQLYAHTSHVREFVQNEWMHLAFTWEYTDRPVATLYVNGEKSGTATGRPCPAVPAMRSPLYLGTDLGGYGGGERSADGTFDSLVVLSRPLSATEARDAFRAQEPEWRAIEARKFQWLRDGLAKPYAPRRDANGRVLESRALLDEGNGWTSPEGASRVIEKLKRAGFNVYIPCVWHGRGTTWPSQLAQADGATAKLTQESPAYDPLRNLINVAHEAGVEVHPWFCVMYRDEHWPHLAEFAEEGTPQGAFEAHNPRFRQFIIDLMLEVVARYEVDGINLDYIRTKGLSRSATARAAFRERYGVALEEALERKQENGWVNADVLAWQAAAVDEIVRAVSSNGTALRPKLVVSIDGHPSPPGSMPSPQGRNGVEWVDKGWVDVLYSMDYSQHLSWEKADRVRAAFRNPAALVTIAGNYERTPERKVIAREGKLVADLIGFLQRRSHGNGVALYLYSMLDDAQIAALRAGPFREDAVPVWVRAEPVE